MSREISNRVGQRKLRPKRSGVALGRVDRLKNASGAVLVALGMSVLMSSSAEANTADNVINGQANLSAAGTYSAGLPGTGSDVTFTAVTYSPTAFTLNTNLGFGTLNDLSTTTMTILSAATNTITLNGGTNNTSGANAADLFYVASGGNLSIGGGTFGLTLALATSGNFDVAGTATINAIISGSTFGFTMTGGGTLTLGGGNTYTGITTVSNGTLIIKGTSAITGVRSNVSINAGAVYQLDATGVGGSHINGSTGSAATFGLNSLTVSGNGTLRVTGGTGDVVAIGQSSAKIIPISLGTSGTAGSGLIDIQGGSLVNGGGGSAVWTSNYASMNIAAGANFDIWDGKDVQIDALTGSGSFTNGSNNGTVRNLTVGDNNGSGTFSGVIGGGGGTGGGINKIALIKIGTGTEILFGVNTYTGATAVNGGSLLVGVGGVGSIASSAVTVNTGGTLGGTGTTGTVTLTGTGTLSPGNSGAGIIHTGNLALGTTGNLAIEVGGNVAGTNYDQVAVTGTVNLGSSSNLILSTSGTLTAGDIYYIINNDGTGDAVTNHFATVNGTALSGSTFTLGALGFSVSYTAEAGTGFSGVGNDVAIRLDSVPEPASLSFLGLGTVGLLARRRRR